MHQRAVRLQSSNSYLRKRFSLLFFREPIQVVLIVLGKVRGNGVIIRCLRVGFVDFIKQLQKGSPRIAELVQGGLFRVSLRLDEA